LREGVRAESIRDKDREEGREDREKGRQKREEWEWIGPDQVWEEIDAPD